MKELSNVHLGSQIKFKHALSFSKFHVHNYIKKTNIKLVESFKVIKCEYLNHIRTK